MPPARCEPTGRHPTLHSTAGGLHVAPGAGGLRLLLLPAPAQPARPVLPLGALRASRLPGRARRL